MAIKSFRDRPPLAVGVTGLLVLALVITAVFLIGTQGLLKNRYEMTGIFSDSGGLRGGEDVLVAGVRVGQVTEVRADRRAGQVVVTWKVDHGVDLGPRTRAEIRMANLLGGRYIRLTGPVTTPYLEDLPAGRRRIPPERTSPLTTVNEVLRAQSTTLGKLDTKTLDEVLSRLGGLTGDDQRKVVRAFRDLSAIAGDVNANGDKITELLDSGDRLLKTVNEKDAQLSRLAGNAQILLGTLRDRRDQLAVLLGSGDRAVRGIDRLITGQQKQLITMVADLRTTMDRLDPHMSDLNAALAWTGPTLHGLSGIAEYGPFADGAVSQVAQLSPSDLARLATVLDRAEP